jgi:hypothetical protein
MPEKDSLFQFIGELSGLARLGGYLARAGNAPPGNTVMWRGLSRLTGIELGFNAAKLVGN